MKISSASKKVLASALSAAMVVAFAPTVAFAGTSVVAKNSYVSAANGQTVEVEYYDAATAFAKAANPSAITNAAGNDGIYNEGKATVALADDTTVTEAIADADGDTALTVDLAGKTLTSKTNGTLEHTWAFTTKGDGSIAAAGTGTSTFSGAITVGTEDAASNVTFKGGVYDDVEVADGSSIAIESGTFKATTTNKSVLKDAIDAAINAGATVTTGASAAAATGAYDGAELAESNYYKVTSTVATVNGTSYSSLQAAADASSEDEPAVLQADVDATTGALTATKASCIDLNGHSIERVALTANASGSKTVTLKGEGKLLGVTTAGPVTVASGAKVSVENSAAKKGENKPTASTLAGDITVDGTLSVAKTSGTSNANVSVSAGGTATIEGGKFGALSVAANGNATVNGGSFTSISPLVENTGVNLTVSKAKYGAAVDGAGALAAKYVASGSVCDEYASGKYEVGAPVATAKVTRKAADGKTEFTSDVKCASLVGAAYNADNKTTVTLDADVEEYAELALKSGVTEVTVDLGGHTVKGGIKGVASRAEYVTVKNGTVNGYGHTAVENATVESGTYTAEPDADKVKPAYLVNASTILGGTFKDATYKVNNCTIKGGTFDKKPASVEANYSATQNADGTYTVSLGGITAPNFNAVNGEIKSDIFDNEKTFSIADKDKALEQAVTAAYSKALTAAWAADPKATALDGFEFAKKTTDGTETYTVNDLTDLAGSAAFVLKVTPVTVDADKTIKSDKDYSLGSVYKVTVAVQGSNSKTIGYLTGVAVDVSYAYAQDTANYTYKLVGADATYDATNKAYTFSTTTGAQFAVESVSNSILELQEQMKEQVKKQQDSDAVAQVKGKTVKAKAKKKTTAKLAVVTSESGAVSTFAKTSGNKKITVSAAGKITVKKGLKAGKTYKAKVKATVGSATKTVTVTVKVAK